MPTYDIRALEKALENVENNDAEAHKLYNSLGHEHFASRHYRQSLKTHREEKRACKRHVASSETARHPPSLLSALDDGSAVSRVSSSECQVEGPSQRLRLDPF